MRLLERDKRTFYYANYTGRTMLMDGNYATGERSTTYSTPTEARGSFSVPSGSSTAREFGTYIDYDYEIHMDGGSCPFDENAAIWKDANPQTDPPDYKVVRIAEPLSHVIVAIRQMR